MTIDRAKLSRQLAKAIAYKAVGQDAKAAAWARKLVQTLGAHEILTDSAREEAWRILGPLEPIRKVVDCGVVRFQNGLTLEVSIVS
jgi:hypothetical protein